LSRTGVSDFVFAGFLAEAEADEPPDDLEKLSSSSTEELLRKGLLKRGWKTLQRLKLPEDLPKTNVLLQADLKL